MENHHLVIYDGVCNFCNGAVAFIIKRDQSEAFVFSPMQSAYAQEIIRRSGVDTIGVDTFMLIKYEKVYLWSDAALEITKDLSGYWYLFRVLKVVPRFVRDYFYKLFARRRIQLFGSTPHCQIPDENLLKRFRGITS